MGSTRESPRAWDRGPTSRGSAVRTLWPPRPALRHASPGSAPKNRFAERGPPPDRIALDVAAHHGMGADDHVVLNGSAAQNGSAPSDKDIVADCDRFLVAQDLTRLALDHGPAVVMCQDGNGAREVNVVADGQKVRVSGVDARIAGTMERNILSDSDSARAQILQVSLVVHKELVVNLPHNVFQRHVCASNLENPALRRDVENVRGPPPQQLHERPLRKA